MRIRMDNAISTWLVFLLIVLPAFLASFKSNYFTWELRIVTWVVMAVFIWGFFQYYLVQGGSYYGKGILG